MDLRGDSHHLIHYDILYIHPICAILKQLPYGSILASSDDVHKANRSVFGNHLGLGRVNRRFESCNDFFGSVCTEDSGASYDDIAS